MENMEGYRVEAWVEEGGLVRRLANSYVSVKIAFGSVLAGAAVVLATASASNADSPASATASSGHAYAAMRAATGAEPPEAMRELRTVGERIEKGVANLGNLDESDVDPALLAAVSARLAKG